MKRLLTILTLALAVSFSQNIAAQGTIVDVAVGNKDFTTLVSALKAADLVTTLQGEGPFTVFAPTNEAFANLDQKALKSLLEPKNKKALSEVLTYHVVAGKLTAADVTAALTKGKGMVELKTVSGATITVVQKDGKIWLKDANDSYSEIVATDVMASNGVIHVINAVVMPKK
jgi:uncharacterized surface protein with fasciclin (FAS1) repeats